MGGVGGPEQQYSLRWNDFHTSILSSFRHLRDQEDFVDVTLACDGCSFTAHKVVLSACSPYFRSLLKANPCQHPIVILRDVREQDMEALLRFMYNGEVHIGQEQLTDFLKTAQTLQVRGLADVPTKDHQKLLPTSNSFGWLGSTDTHTPNDGALSPPPSKRSRSSEHHQTPQNQSARFSPSPASSVNASNSNNNSEQQGRESLLGQALESQSNLNSSNNQQKGNSDSSIHAHSTGEESNSSDTGLSERGGTTGGNGAGGGMDLVHPKTEPADYTNEHHHNTHNNALVLDPSRSSNFPAALLGLQGIPGLLPGPSGMHNNGQDNNFDGGVMGSYDCPLCDAVLPDLLTIRAHIDHHYPRDSPICPVPACAKAFSHPNSVRNHMRSKHCHTWLKMKSLKWTYM